MMNDSSVVVPLYVLGWVAIAAGFVAGCIMIKPPNANIPVALCYTFFGLAAGAFLIGFGVAISLLGKMNNNLEHLLLSQSKK